MLLDSPWHIPHDTRDAGLCRVEYGLHGVRRETDAADADDVPFEICDPVRSFPAWPGKRHYSGLLWMERSRRQVPFESLAERLCLIELDRTPGVALVSSQPMWIKWGGDAGGEHAPDYFVRFDDGSAAVVDVRPLARIDEAAREQFDRTAALCREIGWGYAVYAPESEIRDANLRFLMRYRDKRWTQSDTVAVSDGTIAEVARQLNIDGNGLGFCYAMIWSGGLIVDLDQPLSLRTYARWKEAL